MELEEAFNKVNKIRIDFFDSKYKDVHTEDELAEKYEALCIILQYIQCDSIPKKKIEDKLKQIDYRTANGEERYYQKAILQELLEENK